MTTTMTADRRAAHPRTHSRSPVTDERLKALVEEIAAWLMLAGFAVVCFFVFAVAIWV